MAYTYKYNPISDNFDIVQDTSLLTLKGAVDTTGDLPLTGNSENDVYIVKADDKMYTWNKATPDGILSDWVDIGGLASVDWNVITNKPTSVVGDIDLAVTHKDLITNPHVITVDQLDLATGTVASDIDDVITKKHSQNTDIILLSGGSGAEQLINLGVLKTNLLSDDGVNIQIDEIRARDGDGLKLYNDGGNGIFVEDDGTVVVNTTSYETLVTADNDIPNKKYVDDATGTSPVTLECMFIEDQANVWLTNNQIVPWATSPSILTGGIFTSNQYTVGQDGRYEIIAIFSIRNQSDPADDTFDFQIRKNGVSIAQQTVNPMSYVASGEEAPMSVTGIFDFVANDVIDLYVTGLGDVQEYTSRQLSIKQLPSTLGITMTGGSENVYYVTSQTEIESAIASIGTGFGRIILDTGTITLTSTININGGGSYIIEGQGENTVIDCGADRTAISVTSATSCVLKDFKIDATDLTSSATYVVSINETSDNPVYVDRLIIIGNGSYGIGVFVSSNYNVVRDCHLQSLRRGISISNGEYNRIAENLCFSMAYVGIYVQLANKNTIIGNICSYVVYYAMFLDDSNDNTITGNVINHNNFNHSSDGAGVILWSDNNRNTISSNTITDNANVGAGTSYGVRIYDSTNNNNTLVANTIVDNDTNYLNNGTNTYIGANNVS